MKTLAAVYLSLGISLCWGSDNPFESPSHFYEKIEIPVDRCVAKILSVTELNDTLTPLLETAFQQEDKATFLAPKDPSTEPYLLLVSSELSSSDPQWKYFSRGNGAVDSVDADSDLFELVVSGELGLLSIVGVTGLAAVLFHLPASDLSDPWKVAGLASGLGASAIVAKMAELATKSFAAHFWSLTMQSSDRPGNRWHIRNQIRHGVTQQAYSELKIVFYDGDPSILAEDYRKQGWQVLTAKTEP